MSLSKVFTRASIGVNAPLVEIEVHISNGMPNFTLVGLPEVTVKEAKDRVRSAILNSGYLFPGKRITVNLSPADLPKEGSRYDLPIAIAILLASGQINPNQIHQYEFLGELSLSGEIKPVRGAIPSCLEAQKANRQMIIPIGNASEVSLIQNNQVLIARTLDDILQHLNQQETLTFCPQNVNSIKEEAELDIDEIIGQEQAKRALIIAATGGHNLLLIGPPGTGKTMLATRLVELLPALTQEQAIETTSVSSLGYYFDQDKNWTKPPFRSPHHSASMAALVGGGSIPKPGEISLAHNGVLFLDELPEFNKKVLDALREPLESGEITISRANSKITFPAKVQLVAAMNPSPTGHFQGIHNRTNSQTVIRYLNKLSGPFLDRFDLSIEVPLLPKGVLTQSVTPSNNTKQIKHKIKLIREKQYHKQGKLNSALSPKEIKKYCALTPENYQFLEDALIKLGLSVRAWHRLLKVSRTIADIGECDQIERRHLIEALSYRSMDKILVNLHKNMG